jgi:hypothetical protein
VSRRASLPGASELFRITSNSPALDTSALPETVEKPARRPSSGQLAKSSATARGSGRQKHDAKITVYVSGEELIAMEQARLTLRGSHGVVVDRGKLVREAVALVLADFDKHGADSVLVQRLRDGEIDEAEEATG